MRRPIGWATWGKEQGEGKAVDAAASVVGATVESKLQLHLAELTGQADRQVGAEEEEGPLFAEKQLTRCNALK